MRTYRAKNVRNVFVPLAEDERRVASAAGHRLREEFQAALGALSMNGVGPTQFARVTGLDRSICQRALALCDERIADLEVCVRGPGPDGLRSVADSLRAKGLSDRLASCLDAAIVEFERVVSALGGSQRQLSGRIEASIRSPRALSAMEQAGGEAQRAALSATAAALTGRSAATLLGVHFLREDPDQSGKLWGAGLHGTIGTRLVQGGMPFVVQFGTQMSHQDVRYSALTASPAQGFGEDGSLFREFCSEPLPLTTRTNADDHCTILIDPAQVAAPFDVVIGRQYKGPMPMPDPSDGEVRSKGDNNTFSLSYLVRMPANNLLLDAWIEQDLFRKVTPSNGVYLWNPEMDKTGIVRWYDHLPGGPNLQLLGSGLERAASQVYPRHPELVQAAFERLSLDPRKFIGLRYEVRYPIWGGVYRIQLAWHGSS